jgi:hypothetical protein
LYHRDLKSAASAKPPSRPSPEIRGREKELLGQRNGGGLSSRGCAVHPRGGPAGGKGDLPATPFTKTEECSCESAAAAGVKNAPPDAGGVRMVKPELVSLERIEQVILILRGYKVLLDEDLASLYGVEVKVLNQAVKRNSERFPEDFMFQLTPEEVDRLRSQLGP